MGLVNSFRLFKARGQPGCWYGYVEIDGVTYKIDARHVGQRTQKHFEGTVKRHLKADQQKLFPNEQRPQQPVSPQLCAPRTDAPTDPEFDDSELLKDV